MYTFDNEEMDGNRVRQWVWPGVEKESNSGGLSQVVGVTRGWSQTMGVTNPLELGKCLERTTGSDKMATLCIHTDLVLVLCLDVCAGKEKAEESESTPAISAVKASGCLL